jgi:RNA polymerase sigma-70 factor (ECF subfamily)
MSDSSAELLERARAGDDQALRALLERHQAQVYRFGLKMCRDPEDAKDVLQDTLLAMARSVHGFRGASSLSTWLYTIARRFCIKKRRRSTLAPDTERSLETEAAAEAGAIADPGKRPDDAVAARQVEHALEQAIAELDPMYREVLVLRDVEGLTAPEVAEVLGIGVQAVKSRLHRARLAVRARVAPLLGIEERPAAAEGTCPDVLMLLSRHLEGEIGTEVCAEMERHVQGCGRCKGACESLQRTLALCSATPAVEVPPQVQESVRAAMRRMLAQGR